MEGKIRKKLIITDDYRLAKHIDPPILGWDTRQYLATSRRLPSSATVEASDGSQDRSLSLGLLEDYIRFFVLVKAVRQDNDHVVVKVITHLLSSRT
jgi:hypothetical protein